MRPLRETDFPMLADWLGLSEVRRWYAKRDYTLEEVARKYGAMIAGHSPKKPYILETGGEPIGYFQTYRIGDFPDYRQLTGLPEKTVGIDLFIARDAGRGLASSAIRSFAERHFTQSSALLCLGPEPENERAIRLYERLGFRPVKEYESGFYGEKELLMVLDRYDLMGAGRFSEGRFTHRTNGLTPSELEGFFVGWPSPPTAADLHSALSSSAEVVLAIERSGRVVGFANAISDGRISAFVSMLEVRPGYQRRGLGSELMRRLLRACEKYRNVDLVCNPELQPFYERLGMRPLRGMAVRNVPPPEPS